MENQSLMNYVLVDYENIQPSNLENLAEPPFKVFVFVGKNNVKVPFDLAVAMQALGDKAHYIKMSGNGKNALDFHIAYYLGQLSTKDPEGYFHIISNDSGFDPLIEHLKDGEIKVTREGSKDKTPVSRKAITTSKAPKPTSTGKATKPTTTKTPKPSTIGNDKTIATIIKNLAGMGQGKPRKVKTLANTISTWLPKDLKDGEKTSWTDELQKRNYITVNGENISYNLPKQPQQ